jgi:hypothetical protein
MRLLLSMLLVLAPLVAPAQEGRFGLSNPPGPGQTDAPVEPRPQAPVEASPDAGVTEPVEVPPAVDGGTESTPAAIPADAPAAADAPSEPPPEEAPPKRAEANGYVMGRFSYTRPRTWGLMPTTDVPVLSLLLEVNGQLKFNYWRNSKVYGDVSLVGQAGFIYRTLDADGNVVDAPSKDVASVRPLVSINELYIHQETVPALTFTVGKKRVTFGSGMAFTPTDVLNTRRDPTDPTSQRAGVWLAQAELSLERFTFDVLFSPAVMKSAYGIPYQFVVYPDWDKQDDQAHYQLVARAGALLWDTDLNLLVYYGNKYNDAFEKKFRVGGSVSRVFFNSTEVHGEILVQSGSSRLYFNPACVADAMTALECGARQEDFVSRSLLTDPALRPTVLAGVRHTFPDDSMLTGEYLFQSDGYTASQFQDQVNALDLLQQAAALGIPANRIPGAAEFLGQGQSGDGTPQRFSFQPTAKHYLFLSYMKGQIFNDFTAQLVTVVNLQDLSTLWTPSIQWSATEWLQLGLYGMFPLPGPDALAATVPSSGKKVSEYSQLPMSWRAFFEVRVFY